MSNLISKVKIENVNNYIASSAYGICNSASDEANKIVYLQNNQNLGFSLVNGITVHIKFVNSNTATNPTLNINSTGNKPIYKYGEIAPGTIEELGWPANSILSLTYDGNAYIINSFFNSTGGGGGGGDLTPGSSATDITTTSSSSSGAAVGYYSKADHVHRLNAEEGSVNGAIQLGNKIVSVHGLAAAAYAGIAPDIVDNDTRSSAVTTPAAVSSYIQNKDYTTLSQVLTNIPYSQNINNQPTQQGKATTPKAVVDYIDYRLEEYGPGGGGSDIDLSTDIETDADDDTKATTPHAVVTYINNQNFVTEEDIPQSSPAFAHITTDDSINIIDASTSSGGDTFNISPGDHTYVTLDASTNTIQIGSTLSSLPASQDGTDLTLVTTGDKARWNETSGAQGNGGTSVRIRTSERDPNLYAMVIISDGAHGREGENYYESLYENGNLNFGGPLTPLPDADPYPFPDESNNQQGGT